MESFLKFFQDNPNVTGIIITAFFAIVGFITNTIIKIIADRKKVRVEYLHKCFVGLSKIMSLQTTRELNQSEIVELNDIFIWIQLYGTKEQVKLAIEYHGWLNTDRKKNHDLYPILNSIRKKLRKIYFLGKVDAKIKQIYMRL